MLAAQMVAHKSFPCCSLIKSQILICHLNLSSAIRRRMEVILHYLLYVWIILFSTSKRLSVATCEEDSEVWAQICSDSSVPKRGGGRLRERHILVVNRSERRIPGSYASLRCLVHRWLLGKTAAFQAHAPFPLSGKGIEQELYRERAEGRCELSDQTASFAALLSGSKDEGSFLQRRIGEAVADANRR